MTVNENEIVKRALGSAEYKGIRKFPFKGLDTFIDEVKSIYPSATHLFICDLDNRDSGGNSLLTSRKLRGIKFTTRTVTGSTSYTHVEAIWLEVYAIVEHGMVTVKVARFSMGETES